jgi:hypothetical protein
MLAFVMKTSSIQRRGGDILFFILPYHQGASAYAMD